MSVKSVLHGCDIVLRVCANKFVELDQPGAASICQIQSDSVLRLLAELDNEQQEETSDD